MSHAISKKNRVKHFTYETLSSIDGDHPIKQTVKSMYVGYDVIQRTDGEVAYFNFELAIEMGLLSRNHPYNLNSVLEKEILRTFSLRIINEYDILNNIKIDPMLVKKNQYMATRYLQIQHPNKFGLTSGDGRSIWNGHFKGENGHWDISSCGTGGTRLSPACAIEKKFFRTGTNLISYGCGLAGFREGMVAAIYSDLMYKNGVPTERTLAIIRFKNGTSINVRAAKNLLRPAHFFGYMRRKDFPALKALMDYCINREVENNNFPVLKNNKKRYKEFLNYIAKNFGKVSAIFESEYIFCWMDWDGDNILFNGGIIDYGTIRQFGLFHLEYRYDDVDKMSTTITEQKKKAKHIVLVFAQIMDYLLTGKYRPAREYKTDEAVLIFEQTFKETKLRRLMQKIGYSEEHAECLISNTESQRICQEFQNKFRYFEKAISNRQAYKVADGVTRDAIFCMRDFLREFPQFYKSNKRVMSEEEFVDLVASSYASTRDKSVYRKKSHQIISIQKLYLKLFYFLVEETNKSEAELLKQIIGNASNINRYEKMTGNAIINVVDRLVKTRSKLSFSELQNLIRSLVSDQVTESSESKNHIMLMRKSAQVKKLLKWSNKVMNHHRDSI